MKISNIDFSFKVEISNGQFILLFIAIITVSSLAYKAANANPVEALKYE